jgi:hypothetical protein
MILINFFKINKNPCIKCNKKTETYYIIYPGIPLTKIYGKCSECNTEIFKINHLLDVWFIDNKNELIKTDGQGNFRKDI